MTSNLSEKQEVLLCRLFDGDLGIVNRFFARRLLRTNCDARDFLNSLESISSAVSSTPSQESKGQMSCDLWKQIEQRIESEERAAVFLGARSNHQAHPPGKSSWYGVFSSQALLGGLSGAATTALVLLVFGGFRMNTSSQVANSTGTGPSNSGFVTRASLSNGFENSVAPFSGGSQSSGTRPLIMSSNTNNAVMEVDWMRGDGPLRVIQNPSERSTIIWVNRQNALRKSQGKGVHRSKNGPQSTPHLVLTHAPVELKAFARSGH